MENLTGKYIFTQWKHNNGFQQNWLRKITRQTKTQVICDVQHTLALSSKYKKMYAAGNDYFFIKVKKWAKRFKYQDYQLVRKTTHLDNTDGIHSVKIVNDFNSLLCVYKYNELFETDIRDFLSEHSHTLNSANHIFKVYSEHVKERDNLHNIIYKIDTKLVNISDDVYGKTAKYLGNLFNLPVYRVTGLVNVNTIHDLGRFSESAIHYHMIQEGWDKDIINWDQHMKNMTVSFWVFEDRVVFQSQDGIDSW